MHVIPAWLELISLAYCMGVIACRLWFFTPSTEREYGYQADFVSGMWTLFCFGAAFLIIGSIIELLVRSQEMSGQPFSALPSVLPTVLFRSHFGHIWIIRIAALLLLALSKTIIRYRDKQPFLLFMLILVLIVSMTASATGHAADAGDFSVQEIGDWFHLLAACLWGGGLLVLSISIFPKLIGDVDMPESLIAKVSGRFSAMAGVAVGITTITAIYNVLIYAGSLDALLKSPYGWTMIAKIVLFFALINLGAFNRYISVPLLQEWAGSSAKERGFFTRLALRLLPGMQLDGIGNRVALRFRRLVRIEALIIVGVLFCASLLRHEIPAKHYLHMKQGGGTMPGHEMHNMMGPQSP